MGRRFDRAKVARLRAMRAEGALAAVAIYLKVDPTYRPIKDMRSRRWHLRTTRGEFEILTSGDKWYDTRAKKGGGGAIDLTMHLQELSFVDAVECLHEHGRVRG